MWSVTFISGRKYFVMSTEIIITSEVFVAYSQCFRKAYKMLIAFPLKRSFIVLWKVLNPTVAILPLPIPNPANLTLAN
jgi:hypothetical protein